MALISPESEARAQGVLARLYAARGVTDPLNAPQGLADLLDGQAMLGLQRAAKALALAVARAESILVIGDYDAAI